LTSSASAGCRSRESAAQLVPEEYAAPADVLIDISSALVASEQ
jgi:hypothetical protein